jgi:hypothetical protein
MLLFAAVYRLTQADLRPSCARFAVEFDRDADFRVVLRVSCRSMSFKTVNDGAFAITASHKRRGDFVQGSPHFCAVLPGDVDYTASLGVTKGGVSPLLTF